MQKVDMICYTWKGAIDLYHGVPDLEGAVIEEQEQEDERNCTTLHLRLKDGKVFLLTIRPQEG